MPTTSYLVIIRIILKYLTCSAQSSAILAKLVFSFVNPFLDFGSLLLAVLNVRRKRWINFPTDESFSYNLKVVATCAGDRLTLASVT